MVEKGWKIYEHCFLVRVWKSQPIRHVVLFKLWHINIQCAIDMEVSYIPGGDVCVRAVCCS